MRDNKDIKTISEAYISMLQESNKKPVKFDGHTFSNYKVFNSDKEANEFLEKNDDYGVIGVKGRKVYVAQKSDLGESRKTNYYEIGGDPYDGGVVTKVYVGGKKVYDEIRDGTHGFKYKGREYTNIFKLLDAIAHHYAGVSSHKDFERVELD